MRRLLEGWPLVLILLFIASGSASRPCRNYQYGKNIIAHFDPAHCRDIDEVRWKCDQVLFDPQELKAPH